MRYGETINKRIQDGAKPYLLCLDCEQRFGTWENIFSQKIFMPLHQGEAIKQYGSWMLKFSASISWRVLVYFKQLRDLNHISENLLEPLDKALEIWREFLLDKRPHPDGCEQHILPFWGLVVDNNDPEMPSNFNRYISRTIDIDVCCNGTFAFVYAKMCRILLIGFIEMDHKERWCDTKIHVTNGVLKRKHYKLPMIIRNFLYYKARQLQEVNNKISDRQWEKIDKDYRKYSKKYPESEMSKAITQDYILFGDEAFDASSSDKKNR